MRAWGGIWRGSLDLGGLERVVRFVLLAFVLAGLSELVVVEG